MKAHAPRTVRRLAPRLRPADWVLRAGPQERCYRGPRWPERRRALPTPLPGAVPASSGCAGSRLAGLGRRTSRPAQGRLIGENYWPMAPKLFPKVEKSPYFSADKHCSVSPLEARAQVRNRKDSCVRKCFDFVWKLEWLYSSLSWKGNYTHLNVGEMA